MKKKILFMIINMNIGGTEKALLNMIDEIDNTQYNVTILMLEKYGDFLDEIPSWVNIEYLDSYKDIKQMYNNPPLQSVKKLIKRGDLMDGFNLGLLHLIYKITNDRSLYFKYILKNCNSIEVEYDIAVAYAGPMDLISYYIINNIKAKKKIQWVHFDVTKIDFDKVFIKKLYNKFDKIFVVSKEAKEKLDNLIPTLILKTEVFHNIVSKNKVIKMSEEREGFNDNFNGIKILTVGRLSKEKGQDMIMPIVSKLKSQGYNIRWYLVGDGNLRTECEYLIKKYNIENECRLIGNVSNPYPYMKECDLYVQTSRHEGYCITLAEAMCFNKDIVTTNFTGAKEHIENGINGFIVDISEEGLYKGIESLINEYIIKNKIQRYMYEKDINSNC